MKSTARLIPAICALLAMAAAPLWATGKPGTIEAKLEATGATGATGIAVLRDEAAGGRFSIKTKGLAPGAYQVRVGGTLETLLFVDESGTGEALFDTALFEKSAARREEQQSDLGPLTFDPRGKTIQITRDGQILLAASFPARPPAADKE